MSLLENLTIKRRLQLNAIVVGIAMLVMLVVIVFEARLMLKLNEAIQSAEELEVHELSMRKYEKNFLFYKDLNALEQFNSEYKQLNKKIERLNVLLNDLSIEPSDLKRFKKISRSYKESFEHVVSLQRKIGLHPKDALYGDLRAAVHEVETGLKAQNSFELLSWMLQLRRAEKDFMLRLDVKYLSKFNKIYDELYPKLQSYGLSPLLLDYKNKFTELVDAQIELGLSLNDGALGEMVSIVKETDLAVENIVSQTKKTVESNVDSTKTAAVSIFVVAAVIVMVLVLSTSHSIINPVQRVYQTIERIRRENNLAIKIESSGSDEISIMTEDFNSLIEDFKVLISEVNTALSTINDATHHLSETTAQTSSGMHEQLHEADMVATAATEMQATIQDISHNTEAAAHKAESTNGNAQQGRIEVDATIHRIMALSDSLGGASDVVSQLERDAVTIGSVLDVIRGIAEQTNLLALNAAIEAARAGEQGRGFAVVADEVRSLAQRTQDSTQEIESIISTLQERTQSVVSIMQQCRTQGSESVSQAEKAGELLSSITSDVQTIMEMSTHIATAIDEQNQVASEVNKNVVRIRDIAQIASEHAQSNAQSSEEVSEQAKVLHEAVSKYKYK